MINILFKVKKNLAIIGCGHLGLLIAHHARNFAQVDNIFFFDDYRKPGEIVDGCTILGGMDDIEKLYECKQYNYLIVGIGYKHFSFRKAIFEKFIHNIPFISIIHPSAYVDPSCLIGRGVFILPGCVLDNNVVVGDNVLLNTGCTIAHDSIIKRHTFLSPGVTVAGFVKIGECCNIGINTTIIDNINIADNVQTGGGAVITKSITESGLYVGIPAKKIK